MKNKILVGLLLLCAACTQSKFMDYDDYHNITVGEKISDVQVQVGRPYSVKEIGHNLQEYIYIERVQIGDKRELFRRYILTVENDKIIDKRMKEEVSSPIQFFGS